MKFNQLKVIHFNFKTYENSVIILQ